MITQLNFVEQLEYCCNLNETVNASKLMLHFTLYTGMSLFHRNLKRFNDYPDRFCSSEIECSARIIISRERDFCLMLETHRCYDPEAELAWLLQKVIHYAILSCPHQ